MDRNYPADSQEPDESLMLRYADGDAGAFEALFRRHKGRVYGFIRRFLGGGSSADDLFQEVFLRIARCRNTYRPRARFTTWLYTIVRSVCIDAIRKQKQSAGTVSIQESQEEKMAAENLHVLQPNPREHALQEEVG
ncbi:MAG: sigma-70 family RNA polymerase sigma factor, partial [bacterium]